MCALPSRGGTWWPFPQPAPLAPLALASPRSVPLSLCGELLVAFVPSVPYAPSAFRPVSSDLSDQSESSDLSDSKPQKTPDAVGAPDQPHRQSPARPLEDLQDNLIPSTANPADESPSPPPQGLTPLQRIRCTQPARANEMAEKGRLRRNGNPGSNRARSTHSQTQLAPAPARICYLRVSRFSSPIS